MHGVMSDGYTYATVLLLLALALRGAARGGRGGGGGGGAAGRRLEHGREGRGDGLAGGLGRLRGLQRLLHVGGHVAGGRGRLGELRLLEGEAEELGAELEALLCQSAMFCIVLVAPLSRNHEALVAICTTWLS